MSTGKEWYRQVPIVSPLLETRTRHWKEAAAELLVILLFSLMPVWLGMLITGWIVTDSSMSDFLYNFASSSELGVISAALLGPVLYLVFRDEGDTRSKGFGQEFPSGLTFIMLTFVCCLVATVIYCFNYLQELDIIYDAEGKHLEFVSKSNVAWISWIIFFVSILLVLISSVLRNYLASMSPSVMIRDEKTFTEAFQAQQKTQHAVSRGQDAQDLAAQLNQHNQKQATTHPQAQTLSQPQTPIAEEHNPEDLP